MTKSKDQTKITGMSYRIADEWYIEAVNEAKELSPNAKVRVFTDEAILSQKLLSKLHCDEVDKSENALHAILKMSYHGYLIASKSSFSLWSAYIGNQYTFITEDFEIQKYMLDDCIQLKII
jgi:hypothetical protein